MQYVHNSVDFPVLHESDEHLIYKNPSDEVFIKFKRSGATIRFTGDTFSFTRDVELRPRTTNGLPGFTILKRGNQ